MLVNSGNQREEEVAHPLTSLDAGWYQHSMQLAHTIQGEINYEPVSRAGLNSNDFSK